MQAGWMDFLVEHLASIIWAVSGLVIPGLPVEQTEEIEMSHTFHNVVCWGETM